MSRHHLTRHSSPERRNSARNLIQGINEKNRKKAIALVARLGDMQKVAVRFTSSFSPDLDAIDAFKKGEDYQGYVGKGKNKKLKYEVKGNKLFLLGHLVAEKTKSGLRLNNAGFDTNLTYATFKELGVPVKRIKGTEDVIIGNQKINAFSGEKVNINSEDISPEPVRATSKPVKKNLNRTVTEQSGFRDRAIEKEMKEQGITGHELPLDTTQIQPKDQEVIRGITGIKEKKVKPKRATHAHHLLPVANFPGLKENLNNSIMLTTPSHHELHKYNRPSSVEQTRARIQSKREKPLTGKIAKLKARLAAVGDIKKPNIGNDTGVTRKRMTPKEFLDVASSDGFETGLAGYGRVKHNSGKYTGLSDVHSDDPDRRFSISRDTSQNDWFEDEGQNTLNKVLGTGSDDRPDYRKYKPGERDIFRGDELGNVEYYRRKLRHGEPVHAPTLWVDDDGSVTDHEGRHRARAMLEEGIEEFEANIRGTYKQERARPHFLIGQPNSLDKIKSKADIHSKYNIGDLDFEVETYNKKKGNKKYQKSYRADDLKSRLLALERDTRAPIFGRFSKQREAGIKPLIRKKKTGTIKRKIPVKTSMIQQAKHLSAEALVDNFKRSGVDFKFRSGVYDPISGKILDAYISADKMRLQEMFESGNNKIGFNSITDTRKGPNLDIGRLKAELNEIERAGGNPAIGFDNGSLEALDVVVAPDDATIMGKLLDHQNSTGILSPTEEFKILDNPKYTG